MVVSFPSAGSQRPSSLPSPLMWSTAIQWMKARDNPLFCYRGWLFWLGKLNGAWYDKEPSRCLLRRMQIGMAVGWKRKETGKPPLKVEATPRATVHCTMYSNPHQPRSWGLGEVDLGVLQAHATLNWIFPSQLQPFVCVTPELAFALPPPPELNFPWSEAVV